MDLCSDADVCAYASRQQSLVWEELLKIWSPGIAHATEVQRRSELESSGLHVDTNHNGTIETCNGSAFQK